MGNNLTYRTHNPEKLAIGVEAVVRKDVGSATPLPYRVTYAAESPGGWKAIVGESTRLALIGGSVNTILATIEVDLPWYRRATLEVWMSRVGGRGHVGTLVYTFDMARQVESRVTFDDPKRFTTPRFFGGRPAERLNAVPDLVKRLHKVLRKEVEFGTMTLRTERYFSLEPTDTGTLMTLATLPRTTGFIAQSATTDAGEIVALARLIDRAF